MLKKNYAGRLRGMLLAAIFIFMVLLGRVAWLQLYRGDYYGGQSNDNRLRSTRIVAPRGRIYDRRRRVLVDNEPGYTLSLLPTQEYDARVLARIAALLQLDAGEINKKLKDGRWQSEPIRIKSGLTGEEITRLQEQWEEIPGALLQILPQRRYRYNETAVHVLGYVGEVSQYELEHGRFKGVKQGAIVGKDGIEQSFDKILRGEDGTRSEEVDVSGRGIRVVDKQDAQPGKSLVLTIDYELQSALEQAVDRRLTELRASGEAPNAFAASAVAMDPRTGAIRAMVSRPAYNPNWFVDGISEKNWKSINENPYHPMNNKAIDGQYPAGSTYKIVTGSAALELGKVTPDELIFDSGKHWLIDMRNAGGEALGWLNFNRALAMSDNVYFYEMGNRIGIEALDEYAYKFGFGKPTGIELAGEASGLVPSPEAKKKLYTGEEANWMLGDTFNAAIGQGITLVTPLQLAQMLSTVAAGGVRHKPYLVEEILNDDGSPCPKPAHGEPVDLGISASTMRELREGLRDVTRDGTASFFASLGVDVAGKTGTAENPMGRDHGLFIAYAPYEEPEIVFACVVEQGGYGGVAAAPIVYDGMRAYFFPEQVAAEEEKRARQNAN